LKNNQADTGTNCIKLYKACSLIEYAERLLICRHVARHGTLPSCNTAGALHHKISGSNAVFSLFAPSNLGPCSNALRCSLVSLRHSPLDRQHSAAGRELARFILLIVMQFQQGRSEVYSQ